jgi:hypothetical protein
MVRLLACLTAKGSDTWVCPQVEDLDFEHGLICSTSYETLTSLRTDPGSVASMVLMEAPTEMTLKDPASSSADLNITQAGQYKLVVAVDNQLAALSDLDPPAVFNVVADHAMARTSQILPGGALVGLDAGCARGCASISQIRSACHQSADNLSCVQHGHVTSGQGTRERTLSDLSQA